MLITAIGFAAGACGIMSVIPQVVKVVRSKSTRDLAKLIRVTVTIGNGLWTIYCVVLGGIPIIVGNGTQFILVAVVLRYKLKYG